MKDVPKHQRPVFAKQRFGCKGPSVEKLGRVRKRGQHRTSELSRGKFLGGGSTVKRVE